MEPVVQSGGQETRDVIAYRSRPDPLAPEVTSEARSRSAGHRSAGHTRRRRAAGEQTRRPRLLVIEDDANARDALAAWLELYGYEVRVASDGIEGLSHVTDAEPDLVVTDWRMPGLSGEALCHAIRRRRARLPIVVVTSADEVFEREYPVNARLRKPLDPRRLQEVISAELASAGLTR